MELTDEFLQLLQYNEEGLSDDQINGHFGDRYQGLAPVLNSLLSANRLQLFQKNGTLFYKLVREETAAKFEGLG